MGVQQPAREPYASHACALDTAHQQIDYDPLKQEVNAPIRAAASDHLGLQSLITSERCSA